MYKNRVAYISPIYNAIAKGESKTTMQKEATINFSVT